MALHVYNSLTRTREPFVPLTPGQVLFYACGVTVYDYCHLGHGRTYIVWDTVRRYLEHLGYQVRYVQNFTDIDDKILRRAASEGVPMEAVNEKYIAAYFEDMDRLNVRRADSYPRATASLPEITQLIAQLEQGGYAYAAGGDVYYRVRRFADYGKLSGKRLAELEAGASERVSDEEQARKEYPFDFALWKAAKPGEPAWAAPWGAGRPGWHIECSAMVRAALGETIDIHAGGEDLQFPHHENEIAQSEAVTGRPLARYWLHNAFLNVRTASGADEKMSKSLGNFKTLRDLFAVYPPMALRLFILQTHYRSPIVFSVEAIEAAENAWKKLSQAFGAAVLLDKFGQPVAGDLCQIPIAAFNEAMDEDFNTARALAVIFELADGLVRDRNVFTHTGELAAPEDLARRWRTFRYLAEEVLGLRPEPTPDTAIPTGRPTAAEIEARIAQRNQARAERNWAEADRLRKDLAAQGVILVDHKGAPTTWHYAEN